MRQKLNSKNLKKPMNYNRVNQIITFKKMPKLFLEK